MSTGICKYLPFWLWGQRWPQGWAGLLPVIAMHFQIFPDISRYFQMSPGISMYFQVFPGISRYFHVFQNISRFFQVFQGISRCTQLSTRPERWEGQVYLQVFPCICWYFQVFPGISRYLPYWVQGLRWPPGRADPPSPPTGSTDPPPSHRAQSNITPRKEKKKIYIIYPLPFTVNIEIEYILLIYIMCFMDSQLEFHKITKEKFYQQALLSGK